MGHFHSVAQLGVINTIRTCRRTRRRRVIRFEVLRTFSEARDIDPFGSGIMMAIRLGGDYFLVHDGVKEICELGADS